MRTYLSHSALILLLLGHLLDQEFGVLQLVGIVSRDREWEITKDSGPTSLVLETSASM